MGDLPEAQREKIKLRATYINNLAVGVFVAGVLSPIIALATQEHEPIYSIPLSVLIALLCMAVSFALHLRAVEHLSELNQ